MIRRNDFITNILEGKFMGKRPRGRPCRQSNFNDTSIKERGFTSYHHLNKNTSRDREVFGHNDKVLPLESDDDE